MSVSFEKNTYYRVFKAKSGVDDVAEWANKNQGFGDSGVSYSDFAAAHKEKGWVGRKFWAITGAPITSVMKTAYHLANAILFGALFAPFDDGKHFKGQVLSLVRDLQEIYGWAATLVLDRYGQYHVQEAIFFRSCYECFGAEEKSSEIRYRSEEIEPPRYEAPKFDSREEKPEEKKESKPNEGISRLAEEYEKLEKLKRDRIYGKNEDNTLKKEFEEIKKLWGDEREKKLGNFAEKCLNAGELEIAYKVIKDAYFDSDTKEKYLVRLATAYLKTDADKAVEVIGNIYHDTETKEKFYADIAEAYLKAKNFDKAREIIGKIYHDTEKKNDFYIKVAKALLETGKKSEAIESIKKIWGKSEVKDDLLKEVAEAYYLEGKLSEARDTIDGMWDGRETKDKFFVKIASVYLARGDREKALEALDKAYYEYDSRDPIYIKIARSYGQEGNWEKGVYTVYYKVHNKKEEADDLILEVSDHYVKEREIDKAVDVLYYKIQVNKKAAEAKLSVIAEWYFNAGNLEKALQTIEKVKNDDNKKEGLVTKIVRAHLAQSEVKNAIKAIKELPYRSKMKGELYREAASFCIKGNKNEDLLDVIIDIMKSKFRDNLNEAGRSRYYKILVHNLRNTKFDDFLSSVAMTCLDSVRSVDLNDPKALFKTIEAKTATRANIEAFLRFDPGYKSGSYQNFPENDEEAAENKDAYYADLGLKNTATKDEVKKAYMKLCYQYHPDRIVQAKNESVADFEKRQKQAEEMFKKVAAAYEALTKEAESE